jgi:hypothetical protein
LLALLFPVRATEGMGMSIVDANAREEWPGPREIAGGQFEQATRRKYPDRKNKNAASPGESGVLFDRDT